MGAETSVLIFSSYFSRINLIGLYLDLSVDVSFLARLLLQGLATNSRLFGVELDLSSCEVKYTLLHTGLLKNHTFISDELLCVNVCVCV